MTSNFTGRREFLEAMTVTSAFVTVASVLRSPLVYAAGGDCRLEIFENSVHRWTAEEGPQTERAREMVRQFTASQLGA